eukprot:jgi/Tetstr1/458087/TSEL_044594.t1
MAAIAGSSDSIPWFTCAHRGGGPLVAHERSANVVDGILAPLEDKRLEVGLADAANAQASLTFKSRATERDTDRDKTLKEKDKAAREKREQQ